MPSTPRRRRVLLSAAGVVALSPLLGLAVSPGTALAAPTASPNPSPTASAEPNPTSSPPSPPRPTCLMAVGCGSATPTPEPTPTTSEAASSTPSATRSASPAATRSTRTRSPQPAAPVDEGSLENPVTGGVVVGSLGPWSESPDPVATPSTREAAADIGGGSDVLTRALVLVLGAGVLLGLAGGTGLYATRHRHEH